MLRINPGVRGLTLTPEYLYKVFDYATLVLHLWGKIQVGHPRWQFP